MTSILEPQLYNPTTIIIISDGNCKGNLPDMNLSLAFITRHSDMKYRLQIGYPKFDGWPCFPHDTLNAILGIIWTQAPSYHILGYIPHAISHIIVNHWCCLSHHVSPCFTMFNQFNPQDISRLLVTYHHNIFKSFAAWCACCVVSVDLRYQELPERWDTPG